MLVAGTKTLVELVKRGRTSLIAASPWHQRRWHPLQRLSPEFALLVLLAPSVLTAAEWSVAPTFSAQTQYNDNIFQAANGPAGVWGAIGDLNGQLAVRTDLSEVLLKPGVRFERYPNDNELNSDDPYTALNAVRRWENAKLGLDAVYVRDTTLTQAFGDLMVPSELELTGRVQEQKQRTIWNIKPWYSYAFTDRLSLRLQLDFADVDYQQGLDINLADFTYTRAVARVEHQPSSTDQISASIFAANYEARDVRNDIDSYGIEARFEHAFSNHLRGSLGIGLHHSDQELQQGVDQIGDQETGLLLSASLKKGFEFTQFEVEASRSHVPTGSGLHRRDALVFTVQRQLSSKLRTDVAVSLYRDEEVGERVSPDRDYGALEAKLKWQLTPAWSFGTAYNYVHQEFKHDNSSTEANLVGLAVTYNGPRSAVFR